MDKSKLIKRLAQLIDRVSDFDEKFIKDTFEKDRKMKLRQYDRLDMNENELRTIDITIEI